MNTKYIWVVVVLLVALGFLVFVLGRGTAEAPTDETSDELDRVEEVGTDFMDSFIAIAPPSEDEGAHERIVALLSERALEGIETETLSRDMALFVGVQDIPDEGYEVVDVDLGEDDSAYMVIQLNYSGGPAMRRIEMVKEDGEWKVDSVSEVETEESQTASDFEETGNLVINNPGYPEDVWHLVYERPGAPALTEALIFTEESVCVSDEGEEVCESELLEEGLRVEVQGSVDESGVEVETLRHI